MDFRKRRQTIIVIILAIIVSAALAGVYVGWFRQSPTCFDNRQNQRETGVDCGGPCVLSCERLTICDIGIEWAGVLALKDNYYDLAAKIVNSNPNYGLASFKYEFKIFDAAGAEIGRRAGKNFILPGQNKYLIEGQVKLLAEPAKTELIIEPIKKSDWREIISDYREPEIYIHDKQIQPSADNSAVVQASGIIKNNSDFDFDKIAATVILFDENKKIIGVNKTEVMTVLAGEDRYFSVLWFSPVSGLIKSAEMRADINLFSSDNFMRRFGAAEKFQEY